MTNNDDKDIIIQRKVVNVMKFKHAMWVITGILAVVSLAVGIAMLVDRFLLNKYDNSGEYIECECEPNE